MVGQDDVDCLILRFDRGGKRIADDHADPFEIGFGVQVRGSPLLNGDSQSGKALLDGCKRIPPSVLLSKLLPHSFRYFGFLDDGCDTISVEIGRRKPQARRPCAGNGSADRRDEQIQLTFIHLDEQIRKTSEMQDRHDGSCSAAI